jgi:hypothetical protein
MHAKIGKAQHVTVYLGTMMFSFYRNGQTVGRYWI